MNGTAPERGAGSDDSHRGSGSAAGIARWDTCGKVVVRASFSNADAIHLFATTTGGAFPQSERDLDLPEAAGRRAEGRASGKSAAQRSEQRETSCGWRGVAAALHAEEGHQHE